MPRSPWLVALALLVAYVRRNADRRVTIVGATAAALSTRLRDEEATWTRKVMAHDDTILVEASLSGPRAWEADAVPILPSWAERTLGAAQ